MSRTIKITLTLSEPSTEEERTKIKEELLAFLTKHGAKPNQLICRESSTEIVFVYEIVKAITDPIVQGFLGAVGGALFYLLTNSFKKSKDTQSDASSEGTNQEIVAQHQEINKQVGNSLSKVLKTDSENWQFPNPKELATLEKLFSYSEGLILEVTGTEDEPIIDGITTTKRNDGDIEIQVFRTFVVKDPDRPK